MQVSVVGNQLALTAEVRQNSKAVDQGQGSQALLLNGRFAGALSRTIEFAGEIDDTKAKAEFKDGVLALTLPKKESSQVKRLTIQ